MKAYQVFLFAVVLFGASQVDGLTCPELLKTWASVIVPNECECITESGADPVTVDNWIHYGEYPDDSGLKCAIKCIFLKLDVFDSQGTINETVFNAIIPFSDPNQVQEVYDTCSPLTGTDLCDTAYLIDKCVFEQVTDVLCPGDYDV